MKKIMIIIFLILFSNLFQIHMHSLIRSRIEGTVRDKESGAPLKDAQVTLYKKNRLGEFFSNYKIKTDEKGRFTFDQIKRGEYIVQCEKSGYVTYQPKYKITLVYRRKLAEIIRLEEGEIRHLYIRMEKGGQLKVKVFKKDENGISPYTDFSAQIGFRTSEKIEDIFTLYGISKGGEYFADGLVESDRYTLRLRAVELAGYPEFKTPFEIKKGEVTSIEHIFDFTDNTGVTGVIYLDDEPIEIAVISLINIDGHTIVRASPRIEDKYTFKNIEPGVYTLDVYFEKENKEYETSRKVVIEKGFLKKLDIRLNK